MISSVHLLVCYANGDDDSDEESSWNMVSTDDIVICCKGKKQAEDKSRKVNGCSVGLFLLRETKLEARQQHLKQKNNDSYDYYFMLLLGHPNLPNRE